ncbi:type III-B CRISPR module RAMP protein Cmr6 [Parageobacillus thermoglucosidasius]|uniref:type III-B CRISPR module RAMP protein Cmr6 n=1 Tax=Parageobacillus thermoglucosidasius TaxID=1426 RepID=UPI000B582676|nr:type III-B CRISPR module RAMP protein Cmr6 [Parageobacillus thermoglucosidasius]MBY6269761.1 type III-B CRISPR module RAMP protein Cmr6 [Parageobacillus thermoglucosidasius]MED4905586.1 type III-B CRISPR module RAMP protein Cmr6 [Parageobacillus thermoglucosidasius]MED4913972.1 type III-B CRISPR module RAMP protein Cmr6 [Parageobacillus thermoglucosidasius]MED4945793.1 type III-B CRISPR module RAMP protein Cmr6 [Parageobacillus thermoglucosidasius]MED4981278.1 type III-B CRISPR module RAMP 
MRKQKNHNPNHSKNKKRQEQEINIDELCIPSDTRSILELKRVDNYWLQYHRLVCKGKINKNSELEPPRQLQFHFRPNFQAIPFNHLIERQKRMLTKSGYENQLFKVRLDWHLAIGLGDASVYETSITLHPLYGYPFLPGQAIKGVCHSYIVLTYFDGDEEKALQSPEVQFIFGSQKLAGNVIFTDAIPIKAPKIKKDIINVHFSKYYQGASPPVDYDNPSLVYFPVVYNTIFQFGVMFKDNIEFKEGIFKGQTVKSVLMELIPKVFSEHGIGAKTAVNYGYGTVI